MHAGFKSRQRYVALTGAARKIALNEEWDVRIYNVGQGAKPYFLFDIVATQQCASNSPMVLDEYRYGGMGIRGAGIAETQVVPRLDGRIGGDPFRRDRQRRSRGASTGD